MGFDFFIKGIKADGSEVTFIWLHTLNFWKNWRKAEI
jgi:hypothetical protein